MKGSILFNPDINIEVDVDPSAEEGARLVSAKNLVDGQEAGGGGGGDSDYTEATVKFYNEELYDMTVVIPGPCTVTEASYGDVEDSTEVVSYYETTIPAGASGLEKKITLYKGHALLSLSTLNTVVHGSIEKVAGTYYAIAHGDCEVSFE